jgi:hypothetical protein
MFEQSNTNMEAMLARFDAKVRAAIRRNEYNIITTAELKVRLEEILQEYLASGLPVTEMPSQLKAVWARQQEP